jgi:transcriptional regulator with XRE-family HTH domain
MPVRLKPVIAEKAKEKELERKTTFQKSEKSNLPEVNTTKELAKVAGVSHDTIAKVERIEEDAPAPVVQASRKGEISVNAAYQVTKLEPEQQEEIAQRTENRRREEVKTMSRENERLNNVRRLAYALYQRADDSLFINRIATLLHYMPDQLRQDIQDLESYTAEKVESDRPCED